MTTYEISELSGCAYERTADFRKLINGFKGTGIFAVDPSIPSYEFSDSFVCDPDPPPKISRASAAKWKNTQKSMKRSYRKFFLFRRFREENQESLWCKKQSASRITGDEVPMKEKNTSKKASKFYYDWLILKSWPAHIIIFSDCRYGWIWGVPLLWGLVWEFETSTSVDSCKLWAHALCTANAKQKRIIGDACIWFFAAWFPLIYLSVFWLSKDWNSFAYM